MKHPHRTTKHSPWAWFSKAAWQRAHEAAGGSGGNVYGTLALLESNCPAAYKPAFCASLQEIAHYAGISARQATRVLNLLEDARLIERDSGKKYAARGEVQATRYRLLNVGVETPSKRGDRETFTTDLNGSHKRYPEGIEKQGSPAYGAGKDKEPAPGARPTSKYDGYKEGWKPTAKPAKELTAKDLGF